ncbi:MAG: hypothetical protein WCJ97_10060 [Phycisphaerae bacterium]
MNLDKIVALLNEHHQRATYTAVGEYLGIGPRNVMHGRDRKPLNSWVVLAATGYPAEYLPNQYHPNLIDNTYIITSRADLNNWLAEHQQ